MRGRAALAAGSMTSLAFVGLLLACGGPPTARDILDKPARAAVRDAHASIVGTSNGVTYRGDGLVVFTPRVEMSLHLQAQLGALPAALDILQVDGVTYQRVGMDQWTRSTASPPNPTWSDAADVRLVGEEQLAGNSVWHVAAKRTGAPFDLWGRQRDGYPLRITTTNTAGSTYTFEFDRFNVESQLVPPQPVDVRPLPKNVSGRVGEALTLDGARVTVLSVDPDARPADGAVTPRPGDRFVVVEVQVENVGPELLSTYLDWRLTDSAGDAWAESAPIRSPAFPASDLGPGDASRGFLAYEAARPASGLKLSVTVDQDTGSFALA
jgi:hypothetical protein